MPSAAERQLNKKLSQIFRMNGLALRPDAMQPLYDVLQGDDGWEATLNALLAEVQHQELAGGTVDATAVKAAISAVRQRHSAKPSLSLEVIDAFSMPRARFDKQRRTLVPDSTKPALFAPAAAKAGLYSLRLSMVEQRVRRHTMFKPPALANGINPREHLELTGLDALLGRSGVRVVLGVLSEIEAGKYQLEDAHSSIPLDLSAADVTPGLFTKYSIVLAEGEVQPSGVFRVKQLGLPPPEPIADSLTSLGSFDMLRAPTTDISDSSPSSVVTGPPNQAAASSRGAANSLRVRADSVAMKNAMLVVLSDVWLDRPKVLEQLTTLFAGYEQVGSEVIGSGRSAVPLASFFTFVLCGNFNSGGVATAQCGISYDRNFHLTNFKNLSTIINKHQILAKHSHFILVPGQDDPSISAPEILPRAPLPNFMVAEVRKVCAHVELMSSPCRLVLCGQTIVIHRDELLVKARRSCVVRPLSEGLELNQHLTKSLIDGAHLCPLPPNESPVYWQHDHALWLHPAPEVLILADRQWSFQHHYNETLVFNPGNFASDLSWMVYRPSTKEVEASSLSDDDVPMRDVNYARPV